MPIEYQDKSPTIEYVDETPKQEESKKEPSFGSREFFEEGMLGRIGKGLGQRAAMLGMTPEQKQFVGQDELSKLGTGAQQGMSRLISEPGKVASEIGQNIKQAGKQALQSPGAFTVNLLKGLVQDPEFLLLGGGGAVVKVGQLTKNLDAASQIATKVLAGGAEGAVLGGGMEAAAQAATPNKPFDPTAIGTQAAIGAGLGGGMQAIKAGIGALPRKPTTTPVEEPTIGWHGDSAADDLINQFKREKGGAPQTPEEAEAAFAEKQQMLPFSSSIEEAAKRKAEAGVQKDLFAGGPDTAQQRPPVASDLELSPRVPSKREGVLTLPSDQGIDYWKTPDQLEMALEKHPEGFYDPTWKRGDGLVNRQTQGDYVRDWWRKQLGKPEIEYKEMPPEKGQIEMKFDPVEAADRIMKVGCI